MWNLVVCAHVWEQTPSRVGVCARVRARVHVRVFGCVCADLGRWMFLCMWLCAHLVLRSPPAVFYNLKV